MSKIKLSDFWIKKLYLPLFLTFFVSGGFGLYSIYRESYLNQISILRSLSDTIAKLSRDSLLSKDEVELYRSISRIGSSGEFEILVENKDNSISIHYPMARSRESFDGKRDGYLSTTATVIGYQGEGIGKVIIESPRKHLSSAQIFIALMFGTLILFGLILHSMRTLLSDFKKLDSIINGEILEANDDQLKFLELHGVFMKVKELTRSLILHEKEESKRREIERVVEIAKQVSHDIRSPLSALTLVTSRLEGLPEDQRILLRNASQRITDIANQLLIKGQSGSLGRNLGIKTSNEVPNIKNDFISSEPIMLAPLIENVMSEKRMQYRDSSHIDIELDISDAYGIFVVFDPIELSRIVSNIINNSAEAFDRSKKGKILVAVRNHSSKSTISIFDNGKGIPSKILEKLGSKGFSYGKDGLTSGSGLGIYHAKSLVNKFGGNLEISSRENEGTMITINLNKATPPNWFLEELEIDSNKTIIILDDDQSIHDVWGSRFAKLLDATLNLKIEHYRTGQALADRIEEKPELSHSSVFLIDFELIGHKETGLDWIERLGIQKQATLVTSHFDEDQIRRRCNLIGIKMIPKNLVPNLPISTISKT